MTVCINLIPSDILQARRVAGRRRRWAAACVMLAVVGAAASLVVRTSLRDPRGLASELELAREHLSQVTAKVDQSRAALRLSLQRLAAVGGLADRPNWRVLLSLLAQARSKEIVIDGVALKKSLPQAPQGAPPGTPPQDDGGFVVTVHGRGSNQLEIAGYAIRLEESKLFDSVRQERVQGVKLSDRDLLEFVLECRIAPRLEGKEAAR